MYVICSRFFSFDISMLRNTQKRKFVVVPKRRKSWIYMFVLSCIGMSLLGYKFTAIRDELHCSLVTIPGSYPRGGVGDTIKLSLNFYPKSLNALCRVKNLTAVIAINSAVDSFSRREVLRESVGNVCGKLKNCRVLFLVGASANRSEMGTLVEEILAHQDVLIIDKVDTYRHINNKLVAMLKWLHEYCRAPKYVLFMNDDTYVNLNMLLSDLETSGGEECNCIVGSVVNFGPVSRNRSSQWYVSEKEYNCPYFPSYCKGPAYGFPNALTSQLLSGVSHASYVWPDDVWLTGVVRDHIGASLVPASAETFSQTVGSQIAVQYFSTYFYVHNVTSEQLLAAYNYDLGLPIKTLH